MEILFELISGLDTAVSTSLFLIVMFLLFSLGGLIFKHRKDLTHVIDQWFKKKQEKDELLKMVFQNKKDIEQFAENRVHDREQSFQIQEQLTSAINSLVDKLDAISEKQVMLEEKQNKRIRAEMKDKISQLYRYYHAKGEWNYMEQESFYDLIEEYEEAKGSNSFVHSVVLPESRTWNSVENV